MLSLIHDSTVNGKEECYHFINNYINLLIHQILLFYSQSVACDLCNKYIHVRAGCTKFMNLLFATNWKSNKFLCNLLFDGKYLLCKLKTEKKIKLVFLIFLFILLVVLYSLHQQILESWFYKPLIKVFRTGLHPSIPVL